MTGAAQTAATQAGPPFVELRGVRKTFGPLVALDDVDLVCREGEIHALVGENGAGKSTLIQIVTGVYRPTGGEVLVDGEPVTFRTPAAAERAGIAAVYQELSLLDDLDVAQNVYLHREPRRLGPIVHGRRLYDECARLFEALRIDVDPRAPVTELSIARRQLVELAKALSRDARLVILDEPTASLTANEQELLFELLDGLRARGVAVLYVSHRLEELFRIADRATVLRDGKLVAALDVAETTKDELIRLMVGRTLADHLYPPRPARGADARPVLVARGLSSPGRFDDVDLTIHEGEIVGIAGLIGSGRTSLLRALFGVDPALEGTVELDGRAVAVASPKQALAARIAMVSEDRKLEGLALSLSNLANISATGLPTRAGLYSRGRALARARKVAERVLLRARLVSPTRLLSGGNQQKVVLAKWLATNPRLLLCDEPTRGIDVGAKAEIYHLLRELADEGTAVLFASSELPEVLGLADTIVVMAEGRVVAVLDAAGATEEAIMRAAAGGVPPSAEPAAWPALHPTPRSAQSW